jgi:hypothetical protein
MLFCIVSALSTEYQRNLKREVLAPKEESKICRALVFAAHYGESSVQVEIYPRGVAPMFINIEKLEGLHVGMFPG